MNGIMVLNMYYFKQHIDNQVHISEAITQLNNNLKITSY